MDERWVKYLCKSGQTLFIYNKETGEHKWAATQSPESLKDTIENGESILSKEMCSVASQTDDTGCINGCTSTHANAGCVSTRASVVEVQIDGLDGNIRAMNSNCNVMIDNGPMNINSSSTNPEKLSQNPLLFPKSVTNGHVSNAGKAISVVRGHANGVQRDQQQHNTAAAIPTANTGNATAVIARNPQVTPIQSVPKNVTARPVSIAIPALNVPQPANPGYVPGTLYLGNGKFVNIMVPANTTSRTLLNGPAGMGNSASLPQKQQGNAMEVKDIEKVKGNPDATGLGNSSSNQVTDSETVQKYLVNGMIANVNHSAKTVNERFTKIVKQASNVTQPVVAVPKNAVNVSRVQTPPTKHSLSTAVSKGTKQVSKESNSTASSKERQTEEPNHCVIANVFSYATGDVFDAANQNTSKETSESTRTPVKNLTTKPPGIQSIPMQESQSNQGTLANGVVVKVEPRSPDSEIGINDGIHRCTDCNRTFANSNSLIVHQRTHSGIKPFKCPHCDKEFRHNSSLKVHVKLHTGEKPYKCCSCDRTFRQKVHLRNHLRTHTEDNKFKCSHCERGFRHKGNLVAHLLTHSVERKFRCEACDRTFSQKSHLESHQQSHCKREKDICPYCGKMFKFGSSLNLHMRTHTGEKPFKCSLCDMTFRQKQHLIVHVRRHTGEKPFKCVHCSKAFRHDTALRSHLLIHPESKYSQAQAAMFTEEQRMGNIE